MESTIPPQDKCYVKLSVVLGPLCVFLEHGHCGDDVRGGSSVCEGQAREISEERGSGPSHSAIVGDVP